MMKYIRDLKEGSRVAGVYLCKHRQEAVTKNGKNYISVILQDRTGQLDCKIWDPHSEGVEEFDTLDYVYVMGTVSSFNGALQGSLRQVRKASESEYVPADYLPVTSKNRKALYSELIAYKDSVKDPYLHALLDSFFLDNAFMKIFYGHSAAKTVHHNFVGGLLEHTVSVTRLCIYMTKNYPILQYDLLVTAALLHDIGKIKELSDFPVNDYTDDGQLLGHIMIGSEMIHEHCGAIEGFPAQTESELKHCILAHHGEYEFGSPKKPALVEAMALNLADNLDAKMESWTEILNLAGDTGDWLGYNRMYETNMRVTRTRAAAVPGENETPGL